MKKFSIILIMATVAVTTFGFVSYNSTNTNTKEVKNLTVLKGAEKSGISESNQNW